MSNSKGIKLLLESLEKENPLIKQKSLLAENHVDKNDKVIISYAKILIAHFRDY